MLHWHIVDSISWPYASDAFPKMAASGAYSPSHVYTASDVRRVVAYAKARGIRVIPEFDTPGHARAGYEALDPPILADCFDAETGMKTGTGPLDPTLNATYAFLETLYGELETLFPDASPVRVRNARFLAARALCFSLSLSRRRGTIARRRP